MTQDQYPEIIPQGVQSLDTFVFDVSNIKGTKKDIDLQSEAFAERIKRISEKCLLDDQFQVIPQLLNVSRDPDELRTLAKGLSRVAEIVTQFDELEKKAIVLEVAEEDPSWLAWAFGNFEVQDTIIEDFLDGEDSDRPTTD